MQRIVAVLLLSFSLLLGGCGSKTAQNLGQTTTTVNKDGTVTTSESSLASIAKQQAVAEEKCMEAYKESLKVDCTGMDSRDCMVVKLQAQTARLVASATGKDSNPCHNPDNLWAFMETEVKEKNATVRTGINRGADVATTATIAVGAVKAVEAVGASAGNKTVNQTEGGDATTNNTKTTSETHATATNTGEEGQASSTPSNGTTDAPVADPVVPGGVDIVNDPVVVTED